MAVTVFKMTQLSMTMLEGVIVKWFKNESEAINLGEPLLEVESDKVNVEIVSPATGYVRKIFALESETVPVGGDICIIAEKGDDISKYIDNARVSEEVPGSKSQEKQNTAENQKHYGKIKVSPLAKKVAQELGVDFKSITGTGPGGLITKTDVENAKDPAKASTVAVASSVTTPMVHRDENEIEVIPLKGVRKRIAEHLTISKQNTVSVTTVTEVDMTRVAEYRKIIPVSYTTFVVKVTAEALKEFKILNSSLVGEEIQIKKQVNINVAVATDKALITPVIKNVGSKNILTIAEEMESLAQKGRNDQLTPQDFADGTFTVTNSGIYGSLLFTPVINYSQCAILGIGKIIKTPVVRDDEIVIAPMMYLCLTYDHRIVDGAPAVTFLQKIKYYLENPEGIIKTKSTK